MPSNISTEMLTSVSGDIESLKLYIPITEHFAIKFFLDGNVQMIVLYNVEKNHDEYHLISREFKSLLKNFINVYLTVLDAVSVLNKPTGEGRLALSKLDGMIYLKGCLSEKCKGIKLFPEVKNAWKNKRNLMEIAFDMELNFW